MNKINKNNWNKLIEDLKVAKKLAREASKWEDGGTANLDYVYIRLPYARERKVKEVLEEAGLYVSKVSHPYYGMHFKIVGVCGGQGNANIRANNAVKDYLKSQGWEVGIIYITD